MKVEYINIKMTMIFAIEGTWLNYMLNGTQTQYHSTVY